MSKIVTKRVNEVRHSVFIDRHELKRLVTNAILTDLGIDSDDPCLTVEVNFEDATEGSPAYRVETQCRVNATLNLTATIPAPPDDWDCARRGETKAKKSTVIRSKWISGDRE